mgnify:FL=1
MRPCRICQERIHTTRERLLHIIYVERSDRTVMLYTAATWCCRCLLSTISYCSTQQTGKSEAKRGAMHESRDDNSRQLSTAPGVTRWAQPRYGGGWQRRRSLDSPTGAQTQHRLEKDHTTSQCNTRKSTYMGRSNDSPSASRGWAFSGWNGAAVDTAITWPLMVATINSNRPS